MLKSSSSPIEVCITRGARLEEDSAEPTEVVVESRHACHAVVCNGEGEVVASFGEMSLPTFPRSAIKMLQALAFVEEGSSVQEFFCEHDTLALACGSHSGEEEHVDRIQRWLKRLGLEEQHLACGVHAPLNKTSALNLVRQGLEPRALHHMCSGKHCGMLTLARAKGWDVEGYCEHDHPVQQRVREICAQLFDCDLTHDDIRIRGRDGCSVPTFAVPLRALAGGMARFATPSCFKDARGQAVTNLYRAMTSSPFFVAGSGRADTRLIEQGKGRFVVKSGAEGVYTAAVPSLSLGIALKCADGASRAAKAAIALLLENLQILPADENAWSRRTLTNFRGLKVCRIETRLPD